MSKVGFAIAFIFMLYPLFSSILKLIGYFLKFRSVMTTNLVFHRSMLLMVPHYQFYERLYKGFPTAKLCGGISLVTTLPAPITLPSPIVTPGSTATCPPNQVLLPILIGPAFSNPSFL